MSTTTFDQDNDPTGSIAACYKIIPWQEAVKIWQACPLPPVNDKTFKDQRRAKPDDNDEPDIYIA